MFFLLNTRYLFLFKEKEIQNLRTSEFYEIQKDAPLSMYFSRRHRGDIYIVVLFFKTPHG